jgi:hypothetical protein
MYGPEIQSSNTRLGGFTRIRAKSKQKASQGTEGRATLRTYRKSSQHKARALYQGISAETGIGRVACVKRSPRRSDESPDLNLHEKRNTVKTNLTPSRVMKVILVLRDGDLSWSGMMVVQLRRCGGQGSRSDRKADAKTENLSTRNKLRS